VKRWWIRALLVLTLTPALAGCGQSAQSRSPDLAGLPLTNGARIVADTRRCDRGADPYCALQVVAVGGRYLSSTALLTGESHHLDSLGWSRGNGDTGLEQAAESPGRKLRLIYATAAADLQGIDLGWIQRSPLITRALSRVMFDRAPAMSLMLETGSS